LGKQPLALNFKQMKPVTISIICLLASCSWVACSKKTDFNTPPITDYYPLQVGKSFIYRLDSIINKPFGTDSTTRYYLAKDSIEASFTDALGKQSFRIFRYLRDTAQTIPWIFNNSFLVTINGKNIEYVENNLRFIKLVDVVKTDFTWPGNNYINTTHQETRFYADWNYTYQNVNNPFTVKKGIIDSTITVLQTDYTSSNLPFNPSFSYYERNYSVEVYGKKVGLIYKYLRHWVWNTGKYEDGSFGIRLNLVSYQ
jgi:hypothetical protein